MKKVFVIMAAVLVFSSCKKDLVDTSANEIQDLTNLEVAKQKTESGVNMIFFHASWCKVCKEQRPAFETVSKNTEVASARFYEVEYDDHKDIVNHYKVSSFPTIVLLSDGKEVKRFSGKGHSESDLLNSIKEQL